MKAYSKATDMDSTESEQNIEIKVVKRPKNVTIVPVQLKSKQLFFKMEAEQ